MSKLEIVQEDGLFILKNMSTGDELEVYVTPEAAEDGLRDAIKHGYDH